MRHRLFSRRAAAAASALLALGIAAPTLIGTGTASAQATTECTEDPGTGVVTVVAGGDITIGNATDGGGGEIVVGTSGGAVLCDDATVSNTERIDVVVGSGNSVSILEAPTFAPGRTAEGSGTSEIEFHIIDGSDAPLIVTGTSEPDDFATAYTDLGGGATGEGVNVNGDDDHDILIDQTVITGLFLTPRGGSDILDLTGGDEPPATIDTSAAGGSGRDVIRFRGSIGNASLYGEGGTDTLDLSEVAQSDQSIVDLDTNHGAVPSTSGFDDFSVFTFERVIGHVGEDYLFGTGGRQWLFGRGGQDVVWGLGGDDVLDGGPAADLLRGGAGIDTCIGTAQDAFRSCER